MVDEALLIRAIFYHNTSWDKILHHPQSTESTQTVKFPWKALTLVLGVESGFQVDEAVYF